MKYELFCNWSMLNKYDEKTLLDYYNINLKKKSKSNMTVSNNSVNIGIAFENETALVICSAFSMLINVPYMSVTTSYVVT